jgi:hypothetical protein
VTVYPGVLGRVGGELASFREILIGLVAGGPGSAGTGACLSNLAIGVTQVGILDASTVSRSMR